ncbi:hypothetical protein ACGE0T_14305 [Parabacteroides sp. APC149_11_2_Y6]
MNIAKEHIEQWFSNMIYKYPWIKFIYEVSEDKTRHRICVYPKYLIDKNDDYCDDEINFSMSLDKKFPDYSILFSTEDELFACSGKAKIYDSNNNGVIKFKTPKILNYVSTDVCYENCDFFSCYALSA